VSNKEFSLIKLLNRENFGLILADRVYAGQTRDTKRKRYEGMKQNSNYTIMFFVDMDHLLGWLVSRRP
jgi:hypothetical protein